MKDVEARCQTLGDHFKLNKKQEPKTKAYRRRKAKGALGSCQVAAMLLERYFDVHSLFQQKKVFLEGLSDSNYRGSLDSDKSTTGYAFTVGEAGKELVWLKNFLEELDRAQTKCVLFCDYQSAIHLVKNPVFHGRTKHIKIRYHYIQKLVSEGTLSLKKILKAKNPAYMLTKEVTTKKLKLCATSTGLQDN
nr:retrovirus-related Pol polyprotein from transposon TNT 1-94 [Tanacetum cinerariifolium]